MLTVQQIYDMAIHLMDEQNETTGATQTADTQEYKFRTISILNTAIPALYPYSGDFADNGAGRPSPALLKTGEYKNPDFSQKVPLDDTLCASVLPYFLAGKLLAGENEDLAREFMAQYRETFTDVRNKVPGQFEAIRAPYGLF